MREIKKLWRPQIPDEKPNRRTKTKNKPVISPRPALTFAVSVGACSVKAPITCWKRLICTSTKAFLRSLAAGRQPNSKLGRCCELHSSSYAIRSRYSAGISQATDMCMPHSMYCSRSSLAGGGSKTAQLNISTSFRGGSEIGKPAA